jgi:hypothetical protein
MTSDLHDHLTWLGYLQPDGLVVSPAALVDSGLLFDRNTRPLHQDFLNHLRDEQAWDEKADPTLRDLPAFLQNFLRWPAEAFFPADEQPHTLSIVLPEYQETLRATWAIRSLHGTEPAYRLLVHELPPGQNFDAPVSEHARGWLATPTRRFERLLRETRVGLGLLSNGDSLRLLYAPPGENPGSLTFKLAEMAQIAGRPILGGFHLLFEQYRLFTAPEKETLTALLKRSRDFQANVSTALSHQVLEALFELARGFQAADDRAHGTLLADTWQRDPQQIYGGLISSLLRLVFLLYAEDRGLMPSGELYLQNYSVQGLYDQLRADAERYPDTMDQRFGAWARLLALFRVTHRGSKHPEMKLPARQGHLFDPDRFPFLEGRGGTQGPTHLSPAARDAEEPAALAPSSNPQSAIENPQSSISSLPLLSDGTLHRVLHLLLYLDGERLSYRTLDVEQIGSVYETIMGFAVEKAPGKMIALKPKKAHGAPIHLSLDALLAAKPADREKILLEQADTKLPDTAAKALKSAATHNDLLAALDKRIDRRATPHPVPTGSIILQPTDERRRSGSHYTPRSFTEPIVRKTLEPILDRLGRHPQPEAILDLKIADIAVGSAAFLVETCRQLADELVSSWHFHKCLPVIPPDEDELLYARRLVAQRCLYGVDRNPMAVDLAKLSLWLATMAKDHPFTFLDHSIKCGDSLVGLTKRQIAAFHWDPTQAAQRVMGQDQMEKLIEKVIARRREIIADPEDTEYAILRKQARLAEADAAAQSIKTTGDLAIAAFFAGSKAKERQQLRDDFLEKHLALQLGQNLQENLPWQTRTLRELRSGEHPIRPFHWEIEFPEVFSRENPGFDGIVGNPPFAGSKVMLSSIGIGACEWLKTTTENSKGAADYVAYFYRRAFDLIRQSASFGLIATNTIAETDTRKVGLDQICDRNGVIYNARTNVSWPGEASVVVTICCISKGIIHSTCYLNERQTSEIPSTLARGVDFNTMVRLEKPFEYSAGVVLYGESFIRDAEAHQTDLQQNPGLHAHTRVYINGDNLNGIPAYDSGLRVIDFGELEKNQIKGCDQLFSWLCPAILKEREKQTHQIHETRPWLHWDKRTSFFDHARKLKWLLVCSTPSTHLAFTFVPANWFFMQNIVVIAREETALLALLQSQAHLAWAQRTSSTLGKALRYSTSNSLRTFPFPLDWEENAALEEAGKTHYEYRAELMVRNDEGLTKTYNRFHDPDERSPDILRLRDLHAAMDRAVLDAYGWTDIPTACEFLLDYEEDDEDDTETTGKKARKKKKPWRYRWPDDIRDEVLARLLALNAERHAEEVRLGTAPGMKGAKKLPAQRKKAGDEMV